MKTTKRANIFNVPTIGFDHGFLGLNFTERLNLARGMARFASEKFGTYVRGGQYVESNYHGREDIRTWVNEIIAGGTWTDFVEAPEN